MKISFSLIAFLLLAQIITAKHIISVPVGTNLETIRDQIRSINGNMSEDIVVELAGGTYFLTKTLEFNAQDSATNGHRIIWKNRENERPIISGGVELTNWQNEGNGIISTSVPDGFIFRQLYVNNKKAKRAKYLEGEGDWATVNYNDPGKHFSFDIANANLLGMDSWKHTNKIELDVVSTFVGHQIRLDSITFDNTFAYMHVAEPSATILTDVVSDFDKFNSQYLPYDVFFENAYEFIDEPGEWYLDETADKVYYKVMPGESATNISVIAPSIERLVEINGTSNLVIYGLAFEHSTWLFPSEGGLVTIQNLVRELSINGLKSSYPIPAAIYISNSNNILLERNIIRFTGGTGIEAYDNNLRHLALVGNLFYKTASAAVQFGDNKKKGDIAPEEGLFQPYVSNNYFYHCGIEYHSPVFFGTFPYQTEIVHNEMLFCNAMGINLGWGPNNTNDLLYRPLVEFNKYDSIAREGLDISVMHTRNCTFGARYFENWFANSRKKITGRKVGTNGDNLLFGNMYLDNDAIDNNFIGNIHTNFLGDGRYIFGQADSPNYIIRYKDTDDINRVKANAGLIDQYLDIKNYLYTGSIGGNGSPVSHPYVSYLHDDRDEPVTYTGSWVQENSVGTNRSEGAYLNTYSTTTTSGASASITFTGIGLRIIGPEYNSETIIEVYIDNELDSTVVISGTNEFQKTLYNKTGLEYGEHTVKIVKKDGGKFSLDCIIINRNDIAKKDIEVSIVSKNVNNFIPELSACQINGNLKIHSSILIDKVEIFNLKGQKILTKQVQNTTIDLDLGELSSGSYIVVAKGGYYTKVQKIRKTSSSN